MAVFFNFERGIITNKSENFDSNWNSDALPDLFESLSQPKVKLLNPKRYKEMARSFRNLRELLSDDVAEEDIQLSIEQDFNMGYISVRLSELSVMCPQRFSDIISDAGNFEIYPLADGNIRLDITFQNVLIEV